MKGTGKYIPARNQERGETTGFENNTELGRSPAEGNGYPLQYYKVPKSTLQIEEQSRRGSFLPSTQKFVPARTI